MWELRGRMPLRGPFSTSVHSGYFVHETFCHRGLTLVLLSSSLGLLTGMFAFPRFCPAPEGTTSLRHFPWDILKSLVCYEGNKAGGGVGGVEQPVRRWSWRKGPPWEGASPQELLGVEHSGRGSSMCKGWGQPTGGRGHERPGPLAGRSLSCLLH